MKEIPLSQGRVAFVSPDDFEAVSVFKWSATRCSRKNETPKIYAHRRPTINGVRVTIYLHRFVAERAFGPIAPGFVVDHLDNDGLNCQRENLRVISHFENTKHAMFKPRPKEPWL